MNLHKVRLYDHMYVYLCVWVGALDDLGFNEGGGVCVCLSLSRMDIVVLLWMLLHPYHKRTILPSCFHPLHLVVCWYLFTLSNI